MTEEIYTQIIQELASKGANKEIEAAEFKARLIQSETEKEQAQAALAHLQEVLASDTALQELFDEAEKKLEVDHGLE